MKISLQHRKYLEPVMTRLTALISAVPSTSERKSADPVARSKQIAGKAAAKAAIVSGSLAIPPGPWGLATVLPDLVAVWNIQSQMVADIAGAFGERAKLSKEMMLYCLFKHAASQAVRDLVIRTGERVLVRRVSFEGLQVILKKVGINLTRRLMGKALSRWLVVVGALAVGTYAYYDTAQVAKTTTDLLRKAARKKPAPRKKKPAAHPHA